jgi:hypothetical protein
MSALWILRGDFKTPSDARWAALRASGLSCGATVVPGGLNRNTARLIQRNKAGMSRMLAGQGRWLDGKVIFFEQICGTR